MKNVPAKHVLDYLAVAFKTCILFLIWQYLFVGLSNFFVPITPLVALIVTSVSIIATLYFFHSMDLSTLFGIPDTSKYSQYIFFIAIGLMAIWIPMVLARPSVDCDVNIYHLPMTLFMNHSVWYPGSGYLCPFFGYPSGESVLASVFTLISPQGFENIPNLIIWFVLCMGIFSYLTKKGAGFYTAILITFVITIQPNLIFWQSYNLMTDVPCGTFLFFGLLALVNKDYPLALLFLAFSSVFKSVGTIAYAMCLPYIVLQLCEQKQCDKKIIFAVCVSTALAAVSILRIFIATGNPFFPMIVMKAAPWSLPLGDQFRVLGDIKLYDSAVNALIALPRFLFDFFFFPNKTGSCYWWSYFVLVVMGSSLYLFIKQKIYTRGNKHLIFVSIVICILLCLWFISAPRLRFALGIWLFIPIQFFLFSLNRIHSKKIFMRWVYISLVLTFFVYNVPRQINHKVISLLGVSDEKIAKAMPFKKTDFTTVRLADGFIYSVSTSGYCWTMTPPCIYAHSVGSHKKIIRDFRKYNHQ